MTYTLETGNHCFAELLVHFQTSFTKLSRGGSRAAGSRTVPEPAMRGFHVTDEGYDVIRDP